MAGNTRSVKARSLPEALKNAREDAGLSVRALAAKLGMEHPGTLGRWETGARTPKVEDVERVLDALDVDSERRGVILAYAHGTDEPRWLAVSLPEQRAQMSAIVDLEASSTHITVCSPLLIPGLAQTSDYIRALLTQAGVQRGELSTLVAVRVGRRDVITRHDPASVLLLIGEAALRQVIGDREIMARQLRYLIELTELPNVEVRVLPFDAGWHAGLEGPFTMFEADGQRFVHMENRKSGVFLHDEDDVELYRAAVEQMIGGPDERGKRVAMSPAASAELIAQIANEMETTR